MEDHLDPLDTINIFREIVRRYPYDRYYAARSQLYIGICYKRMGSNQALQAFQEVIDNFPDQTDVVKIAEAEIASLAEPNFPILKKSEEEKITLIWKGKSVYGTSAVSSNGRYFSFVDLETGDLMFLDLIPGEIGRLTKLGLTNGLHEYVACAAISPSARQIAYGCKNIRGSSELRVVGLDGSGNRTLFKDEEVLSLYPVDWTVDEEQVLVSMTMADLTNKVVFVSSSDGAVKVIKDMGLQRPHHLSLSPDGRWIGYDHLQNEENPERDIFLYSLEEKKEIPLVLQPGDDVFLGWTLNGKNILYTNNQTGTTDIWLLAVQEGMTQQTPRRVKSDIGPIDPIGFARNGAFYFEAKPGMSSESELDRRMIEIKTLEKFLPEERKILTVPDDYPTIQSAVSAARPYDTVFVRKGLYEEHIIIGKFLTLKGEDRNDTIIDGGGNGSVIRIAASHVMVSGFTVQKGEFGIEISSSEPIYSVTVCDNRITLNITGIFSKYSGGHHLIEKCIISHNELHGINVHQFSRSIIRECEVFGNRVGIQPAWSWYISVERNRIYKNQAGICIDSCYSSIVERNLIHANENVGIAFSYIAGHNTIKNNIISKNCCCILVGPLWGGFGENSIYHNDIWDNRIQVYGKENSIKCQYWDNGYPSGGNFWSDYTGLDAHKDGIGDQPYDLVEGARDNYPLMKPRNKIQASVKIDQGWIDLGDNDKWITLYIELPADLAVKDIEVSTLSLNDTLEPKKNQIFVGDYDADGVSEMRVKFRRLKAARIPQSGEGIKLIVTGKLENGIPFEGQVSLTISDK
jgi:nitrous oxidase accessory protein NosD